MTTKTLGRRKLRSPFNEMEKLSKYKNGLLKF